MLSILEEGQHSGNGEVRQPIKKGLPKYLAKSTEVTRILPSAISMVKFAKSTVRLHSLLGARKKGEIPPTLKVDGVADYGVRGGAKKKPAVRRVATARLVISGW